MHCNDAVVLVLNGLDMIIQILCTEMLLELNTFDMSVFINFRQIFLVLPAKYQQENLIS